MCPMNQGISRSIRSFFNHPQTTVQDMTTLNAGDKAPYFEGLTDHDQLVRLTDYAGKKLVLFFYPADNTPTCTAVACNLRDHYAELTAAGYSLLGVSPDTPKKHQNFIKKYAFPFPLLSDPEQIVMRTYGIWGEKQFMGRTFDGVHRTTFVISEAGVIEKVITKVNSKAHFEQILQ